MELIFKFMPLILVVQYALLGVASIATKHYGNALYWIAAAILTIGIIKIPVWG